MIRRYGVAAGLWVVVALFAGTTQAQDQETLAPSKDNSIYEESGDLSNGEGQFLFVGNTNQSNARRALIAFDIAGALPEDARVDSVELSLHVSQNPPGAAETQVDIHRVTSDWGEGASDAGDPGGSGAPAEADDATWTFAFYESESWQTQGGDFVEASSATLTLGASGERYAVTSSATLAADVQSWLDDPSSNFGWILVGDESETQTARRLDSGDHATEANHPQLEVYYSTGTATEQPDLPGSFVLEGNFPNPFSRATTIRYVLDRPQQVELRVYDVTGRPVKTIDRRAQAAGTHHVELEGIDMASGLYIYCVSTSSSRECRTLTVMQ